MHDVLPLLQLPTAPAGGRESGHIPCWQGKDRIRVGDELDFSPIIYEFLNCMNAYLYTFLTFQMTVFFLGKNPFLGIQPKEMSFENMSLDTCTGTPHLMTDFRSYDHTM